LFASNHKDRTQTDIILTLTPHIIRVLDLTEADLRPFKLGRDTGSPAAEPAAPAGPPRDQPPAAAPAPALPAFPQPLEGKLPGVAIPNTPPPPKKGGGGGTRS
jgi:hypothetical protein